MIYLYSGTPGSGKSLHMARNICNMTAAGISVVCNFPVDLSKLKRPGNFKYVDNTLLSPAFLLSYSKTVFKGKGIKEGRIKLFIDESQLLFNAREYNMPNRKSWLSFFTQHRHFGYDIYLVAQFDRMLDRQIRSLVEYEYIHRKVSNYGFKGRIISLFALGNLFVCVKTWYPLKEKVGSEFFRAKKRYYSLYDTYMQFEDKPGGGAVGSEDGELGAPSDSPMA